MSKSILPRFSFRSFVVLGLIFKPLIHFEFIFVYDVRKWSSFILLHVADRTFMFNPIYSSQKLYDIGTAVIPFYRRRSGDLAWPRNLLYFTQSVRVRARI